MNRFFLREECIHTLILVFILQKMVVREYGN